MTKDTHGAMILNQRKIAIANALDAVQSARVRVSTMLEYGVPLDHVMVEMVNKTKEWERHLTSLVKG